MIAGVFEIPGWLIEKFYEFTSNYAISIALIAVVVMVVITPLTLKSTKGMLEMQRLAPETKRLQQLYRNDRAKLNEEMMALYKEHKVNPMASCLPLLAQMPVFIIMFRVLHGLIYVLLVALLGILYSVQQRMVAARAAVSPQMSPSQQKLMQYLPVAFAIF